MPNAYVEKPQDWGIKYGGCYARTTEPIKDYASVVKIRDGFYTGGAKDAVLQSDVTYFKTNDDFDTVTSSGTLKVEKIDWKPLQLGAINLLSSVVMINAKQPEGNSKYRQLPHDQNVHLVDPFMREREHLDLTVPEGLGNYFVLDSWGKNKYFPATEALKLVQEHKRLGCAFSPNYFFGISLAGDGIFLWKHGYRIARVGADGKIALKPQVHVLSQMLSEHGLDVRRINK